MRKLVKSSSKKIGLPPGTLVHVGEKKVEQTKITIIDYDEAHFEEKEIKSIEDCFPLKDKPSVKWINIDGLHEVAIIEKIGSHFNIHPLVLEDILHTNQRPKIEDFENYVFIVLKMLYQNEIDDEIIEEQISIILGSDFILSFQEKRGDVFDHVRERMRTGKGRIRKNKADYLAYSLMDAVVDNYFIILEKVGEDIEILEEELLDNPSPETLQTIHSLKRKMISLRKTVWPLREVIALLERGESPLINDSTIIYLRDVYDHTIQVIDTIETFRDMISGMLDIYLSSVSNKMNEVMKVLTVIATLFIPLTFIAGIYGMNFEFMPELKWHWGYPIVWLIMLFMGIGMMLFFRKRKWF